MKKMIILDGNSIMFRAYFATAYTGNLMQARSGLYTNAIYGFVNMIQHIIQTPDMTNIFVAFDKGKKTLRHQEYSEALRCHQYRKSKHLRRFPSHNSSCSWSLYSR